MSQSVGGVGKSVLGSDKPELGGRHPDPKIGGQPSKNDGARQTPQNHALSSLNHAITVRKPGLTPSVKAILGPQVKNNHTCEETVEQRFGSSGTSPTGTNQD